MRIGCTTALSLAALLALAACGEDEAPQAEPEISRAVTVATVQLRPISGVAGASGLLVPREEAAVGSELSGYRVVRVYAEEGDHVDAGEPLAKLDDALLQSQIAEARARAQQAQGEADRVRGLDGTGVLSDEEIAQRRGQARIAQAQLNDLTTRAGRLTVRSPVSGLVLERNVRPGAVSGGGEPMFRIARDGMIELDAEVPEDALGAIREGSQATVTLPTGEDFQGTVRLISPRIDPETKLGRVRIKLPVDPALRAGGFARVTFQRKAEPVPALPEKAIQFEAGGPLVTVIGKDNRARRVPVRTGARANGWVELLDGPPPGTRVALGGGAFLLDGDLVTPVKPGADQTEAEASGTTQ